MNSASFGKVTDDVHSIGKDKVHFFDGTKQLQILKQMLMELENTNNLDAAEYTMDETANSNGNPFLLLLMVLVLVVKLLTM